MNYCLGVKLLEADDATGSIFHTEPAMASNVTLLNSQPELSGGYAREVRGEEQPDIREKIKGATKKNVV